MQKLIFTSVFILSFSFSGLTQNNINNFSSSEISKELSKKQITHLINCWNILTLTGSNNMLLILDAVKYSPLNVSSFIEGTRISLIADGNPAKKEIAKSSKFFTAYIDKKEYTDIKVVLSQMLSLFKTNKFKEQYCSMQYITKSNIKLGFDYTINFSAAYISILYGNREITFETSNIEKFLSKMYNSFDIASKELYTPENIKKSKKVKKSDNKTEDVDIDDL
jgi:hypothetical protein